MPTSRAVGVASPSAQGQAMISTATAAVKASAAPSPATSRNPSVATASAITIGHEHGRDPVGEPLHRRLAALRLGHESGDLGQGRVGTDSRGPHDEPPAGVDGRARHRVARPDLDGHRFAGEQRGVDRGGARFDDAVRRDLLARPHDEAHPDRKLLDRDPHLARRRRSTATSCAPRSRSARSAAPELRLARASK